jgi:hypothetical protein
VHNIAAMNVRLMTFRMVAEGATEYVSVTGMGENIAIFGVGMEAGIGDGGGIGRYVGA